MSVNNRLQLTAAHAKRDGRIDEVEAAALLAEDSDVRSRSQEEARSNSAAFATSRYSDGASLTVLNVLQAPLPVELEVESAVPSTELILGLLRNPKVRVHGDTFYRACEKLSGAQAFFFQDSETGAWMTSATTPQHADDGFYSAPGSRPMTKEELDLLAEKTRVDAQIALMTYWLSLDEDGLTLDDLRELRSAVLEDVRLVQPEAMADTWTAQDAPHQDLPLTFSARA